MTDDFPSGREGPYTKLIGHQGAVLALVFNANGKYCLTAGRDRTVRLWNARKGLLVKTYGDVHAHEVRHVCCSQDNGRLASCGGDKQVFLYDVASGSTIRKFKGHDTLQVNAVHFGASDTVLFSGGYDATLRAWDCRSRSIEPIQVMKNFKDSVTSIVVCDNRVIAGSVDGTVHNFDVRMGVLTTDSFGPPVTSLSLSSDTQCLLVGLLDSRIALLDRASGEALATYTGHKNKHLKIDCCFTHDDAHVISGSEDGWVYFWDLVDMKMVHKLQADENSVCALAWHPEGAYLLTANSSSGNISMWRRD